MEPDAAPVYPVRVNPGAFRHDAVLVTVKPGVPVCIPDPAGAHLAIPVKAIPLVINPLPEAGNHRTC